jgi:hypothetical protein
MNRKMYSLLTAGSLAAALVVCGAAQAKVWDFSYSGGGETGSGTFITGDVGSPYMITSITGTADGSAITGLSSYAGADQLLYIGGPYYADYSGISFATAAAIDYNLTNYPDGFNNITNSAVNPGGVPCCTVSIDMGVAAVPEPATWAMMLLGFAGLGFAGHRKSREAISLAV